MTARRADWTSDALFDRLKTEPIVFAVALTAASACGCGDDEHHGVVVAVWSKTPEVAGRSIAGAVCLYVLDHGSLRGCPLTIEEAKQLTNHLGSAISHAERLLTDANAER